MRIAGVVHEEQCALASNNEPGRVGNQAQYVQRVRTRGLMDAEAYRLVLGPGKLEHRALSVMLHQSVPGTSVTWPVAIRLRRLMLALLAEVLMTPLAGLAYIPVFDSQSLYGRGLRQLRQIARVRNQGVIHTDKNIPVLPDRLGCITALATPAGFRVRKECRRFLGECGNLLRQRTYKGAIQRHLATHHIADAFGGIADIDHDVVTLEYDAFRLTVRSDVYCGYRCQQA